MAKVQHIITLIFKIRYISGSKPFLQRHSYAQVYPVLPENVLFSSRTEINNWYECGFQLQTPPLSSPHSAHGMPWLAFWLSYTKQWTVSQNNLYLFNKTLKTIMPCPAPFFPLPLSFSLALKGLVNVSKLHIRQTSQTINLKDTHRVPAGFLLTPLASVVLTPSFLQKPRVEGCRQRKGWVGVGWRG